MLNKTHGSLEPQSTNPGTASPGYAPAFALSIPAISNIPEEIFGKSCSVMAIRLLAHMNRHMAVSPRLKATPEKTLEELISSWIGKNMPFTRGIIDAEVGIAFNDSLAEVICIASNYDENTDCILFFRGASFHDSDDFYGDHIEAMEKENPGLGKWLLHLIETCPFQICTPSSIFESVSEYYWGCEPDEQSRVAEIIDGTNGKTPDDIDDYVGVRLRDFEESLPAWSYQREFRYPQRYTGTMPNDIRILSNLYDQLKQFRKRIPGYIFIDNMLPICALNWNRRSFDIMMHVYENINQDIWNCGLYPNFGAVAASLPFEKQSDMKRHLMFFETCLRYFDQSIRTINSLQGTIK